MKEWDKGAPGWLSRSRVLLLISAPVMISRIYEIESHVGLCTDSAESARDYFSPFPSLSLSLLCTCAHMLSLKINKHFFKKGVGWGLSENFNQRRKELEEIIAAQVVSFKIWGWAFRNTGNFLPSYRGHHPPAIYLFYKCFSVYLVMNTE